MNQEFFNRESADLGVRLPEERANWEILSTQSDAHDVPLPERFYSPEHSNRDVFSTQSADLGESAPESLEHPMSQRDVSSTEDGPTPATSSSSLIDSVGRGSNSGSPISVDNRISDRIDLEVNTEPKGEVRYIKLQMTRQRANSFPHNWPHRSSYQGLEEPKLSQTGETDLDAEESHNDHDSDSINTRSANERAWEMAFESQEKTYESEMAELREGHQQEIGTLKLKLQDEAKAANSRKLMLQKRVKKLTQEKAKLQGDLESNAERTQQALSVAQESQFKFDEMEKKYNSFVSSICHEDNLKYETIRKLTEENEKLAGVISSMQPEQTRETTPTSGGLNQQSMATPAMVERQQELEQRLESVSEEIRVLTAGLGRNQIFASQLEHRNLELYSALNARPNEVANISGVIELKDQMLSDAERTATECVDALKELRETSNLERVLAAKKIAMLKVMLELSEKSNAGLQESKSRFQHLAEAALGMLQGKVFQTELTAALENYSNAAIQDNEDLTSLVSLQHDNLSSFGTKVVSLESEIRNLEKASATKDQRVADLEDQGRTADLEIGRLEVELEAVRVGQTARIDRKVARLRLAKQEITALKQDLKAAFDEKLELLKVGLDERGLAYANWKAQECERLSSANQKLEEDLSWSERVAGQNAAQIEHIESEMAKAKVVIETLQGQINGQVGLPVNACVAELVLICQTAIDKVAEEPRRREVEPDSDDDRD